MFNPKKTSSAVSPRFGNVASSKIDFPNTILTFRKGTLIENEKEHPGMGYTVPYNTDGLKATIFVYDLNLEDIPDGPESSVVIKHFKDELAQLDEAVALGIYEDVSIVDVYGIGSPEWGEEFLCAEMRIFQNDQGLESYMYLTGYKGRFVKIRITGSPCASTGMEAKSFADEIAIFLWSNHSQNRMACEDTGQ